MATERVSVKYDTNAKQAAADTKKFKDSVGGLGKNAKSTTKGVEKLRIGIARLRNRMLLATFAVGVLTAGLVKALQAAEAQEAAVRKLNQTLKSTESAAGLTSKELQNMASELQAVTKFGDETTIGAQSLLLTFTKIGKDVFPRALKSILDVSTGLGQDLKSSAIQLGKALNDPILGVAALSRVGIQLGEEQKELIKNFVEMNDVASAQSIILDELETQFGGQAAAAAETFGGKIVQLGNAFGDFIEDLGFFITKSDTFIGIVSLLTSGFTQLSDAIRGLNKELKDEVDSIINAEGGIDVLNDLLKENEKVTKQVAVDVGSLDDAIKDAIVSANAFGQELPQALLDSASAATDAARGINETAQQLAALELKARQVAEAGFKEQQKKNKTEQEALAQKEQDKLNAKREKELTREIARAEREIERVKKKIERIKKLEEREATRKTKLEQKVADIKKKIREDAVKAEIELQIASAEQSAALLGASAELAATFGKKGFALGKALAISSALLFGGVAITRAFADHVFPLSALIAATVAVQTATQLRRIQQTKPPKFAGGGSVSGAGTGTSDSILARLSDGEFVLSAKSVARIGADRLEFMNKFGKLPQFQTGGAVSTSTTDARQTNDNRRQSIFINQRFSAKELKSVLMSGIRNRELKFSANINGMSIPVGIA